LPPDCLKRITAGEFDQVNGSGSEPAPEQAAGVAVTSSPGKLSRRPAVAGKVKVMIGSTGPG